MSKMIDSNFSCNPKCVNFNSGTETCHRCKRFYDDKYVQKKPIPISPCIGCVAFQKWVHRIPGICPCSGCKSFEKWMKQTSKI